MHSEGKQLAVRRKVEQSFVCYKQKSEIDFQNVVIIFISVVQEKLKHLVMQLRRGRDSCLQYCISTHMWRLGAVLH